MRDVDSIKSMHYYFTQIETIPQLIDLDHGTISETIRSVKDILLLTKSSIQNASGRCPI